MFEEFKGVLTGYNIEKEFLSRQEYLQLGVKQSIFLADEREHVYDLFEKYLMFLHENNYYDSNLISHRWLDFCLPRYDFVIVDEVQDYTNIQLWLILKSLKNKDSFILCGDSNQIVHPNFFSWSKIKTMFYHTQPDTIITRILTTNYRNSPKVTETANRLLKVKNTRFGSIDKESTYLIRSVSSRPGEVVLLEDSIAVNILKYLLAIGANTEERDNFGRNALQTALFQGYFSEDFTRNKLGFIYQLTTTESINLYYKILFIQSKPSSPFPTKVVIALYVCAWKQLLLTHPSE